MLDLLLAVTTIGAVPPDPRRAADRAIERRDIRLAGVTTFWGSLAQQRPDWRPYGLICASVPASAYAYRYLVSDAIGPEAMAGYRRQRRFLIGYNVTMLRSGLLPARWGCRVDRHPGRLG